MCFAVFLSFYHSFTTVLSDMTCNFEKATMCVESYEKYMKS